MNRKNSEKMFQKAKAVLVGGVNSPVRAFKSVGGTPVFFREAKGARMKDVDGNSYIDYVGSWGPMILGHGHPDVVSAIVTQARRGTSFGAPGELEHLLAKKVIEMIPSLEKVRFVNSGTEATLSAIRVARGFTRRDKILKFEGCYHGHGDSFLIAAGSGALTFGTPDSAGVTDNVAMDTITVPYNNLHAAITMVKRLRGDVAAIILEPVVGNMGVVPPAKGFLAGLRRLCDEEGVLLIFDEVMTGFRLARGGAQQLFGVKPDMTTFGKIIGGGLPVGAYGARAEIMDMVSPLGPIYQAGTLSGNPVAMAAGLATLSNLNAGVYRLLEKLGARLEKGFAKAAAASRVPVTINRVGSMFTAFFQTGKVTDLASAKKSGTARFAKFYHGMLDQGIYFPPSQFEAAFISAAHTEADIDKTIAAAAKVLKTLA